MNDDSRAHGDRPDADDDYSATALASHWIRRPDSDDPRADADTLVAAPSDTTAATRRLGPASRGKSARPGPAAQADAARLGPGVRPDRVDGTLLRFGPGVNADTVRRAHGSLPAQPTPRPRPRHRAWRRHALPTLVLLGVLAFLAWDRAAPPVGVRDVTVSVGRPSPGCDGTADIVATVTTDGRAGTLTYRWVRSDGTSSEVLREDMPRGRRTARLHLLWSFHGEGRYTGRAELRLLSPERRTNATYLTYVCS
ncbi:hypothetical protein ACFYP4_21265 [Streptomyces sp. NPDC005551]|uniref:hypothetical protein n=1 Tax=unclassified Streptomyces TaxID=2593676 RepID=UPI0033E15980